MKKLSLLIHLILLVIFTANAQEQTPATEAGEDFDLEGVIAIFEESEDLEDFEKKLNDKKNEINNLDLNADEEIDVLKVVEYKDGETHVIVIQAVVGDNDVQDIASIEIEKHGDDEISLQVIGDPDIYGPDYIVEPAEEGSGGSSGGGDSFEPMLDLGNLLPAVFVSVRLWRPVVVMFRPGRVLFVSAVLFGPRPIWFVVRRPIARSTWRARSHRYSHRCRHATARHSKRGGNMYKSKRRTSPTAKKHYGHKNTNQKKKATTTQQKNTNQKNKANTNQHKNTNQKKKGTTNQKKKKH